MEVAHGVYVGYVSSERRMRMMQGFVTQQVILRKQLCDVCDSELNKQMETPRISPQKHTGHLIVIPAAH